MWAMSRHVVFMNLPRNTDANGCQLKQWSGGVKNSNGQTCYTNWQPKHKIAGKEKKSWTRSDHPTAIRSKQIAWLEMKYFRYIDLIAGTKNKKGKSRIDKDQIEREMRVYVCVCVCMLLLIGYLFATTHALTCTTQIKMRSKLSWCA